MTEPEEPSAFKLRGQYAMLPGWAFQRLEGQPAEVSRFYWWLCLVVIDYGDREGYKRISEMAEVFGVGESTVRRWVDILRKCGVITVERYRRKSGRLGQNVYTCPMDPPPLPTTAHPVSAGREQDESVTTAHPVSGDQRSPGERSINREPNSSTKTAEPLRSSPAPASPAAEQPPLIPDEILDAEIVDDRNLPAVREEGGAVALNAGVITKEWVDYCARGGVKLPNETIKRYAAAIKKAADEHFEEGTIRAALTAMARDRVIPRPSLFTTYLARVQVGPELPPERVGHAEASRIRQAQDAGKTPDEAAAEMRAFLAIPDPRKSPAPTPVLPERVRPTLPPNHPSATPGSAA